ncbi:hypothetical protein PIB30_102631, partial [Stylosanthes scabra]|nr:hypothetical protein [Stylosanthes scabra]
MFRSHSDSNLVSYDPEIERTLRNSRRIRRQNHFENHSVVHPENTALEEETIYSSASESDFELPFSDTGTIVMADNPNQGLTLRELCSPEDPIKHLKDPIKHLKDFEVVCATTRRTGGDEPGVMAFAFLFSLEGKAKD